MKTVLRFFLTLYNFIKTIYLKMILANISYFKLTLLVLTTISSLAILCLKDGFESHDFWGNLKLLNIIYLLKLLI